MKTRVVVADEHVSVRQMLTLVLEREGSFQTVGEAGTGFEALNICRQVRPQLVVLDLVLPELNGVEVLRTLRRELHETRCIVYSGTNNRMLIAEALQARPHGFVHKRDALSRFCEAVHAVSGGCCYFTPFATRMIDEDRGLPRMALR